MRRALLILFMIVSCSSLGVAQVSDQAIERMMDRRMMPCIEVEYNSILLLPRLYSEGKADTFDAVLGFWQKHCEIVEPVFTTYVLNAIKNRTFNERLEWYDFFHRRTIKLAIDTNLYKNGVLRFLLEYKNAAAGQMPNYLRWGWSYDDSTMINDYRNYYRFLQQMAESLKLRGGLSPVEDFLVRYYANPSGVALSEIDSPSRQGSVLQQQYKQAHDFNEKVHGMSQGVSVGMWKGVGGLSLFGLQPFLGYHIGGRGEKVLFDMRFDVLFGSSNSIYSVRYEDSVYRSSRFFGVCIGGELGRRLFKADKNEVDAIGGIGYNMLEILRVNHGRTSQGKDSSIVKTVESLNVNFGFSYKIYISNTYRSYKRRFTYLAIEPTYNIVRFNNNGGTDISGDYFLLRLTLGGYLHGNARYPYID